MRAALLLLLCVSFAHAAPYPRLASYAGQGSTGNPFLIGSALDSVMCQKYARYGLVTVDMNAVLHRPDIALCLRYYNPKVRIIGYRLINGWWLNSSFIPSPTDKTLNAYWQWGLLATGGHVPSPPSGFEVDWAQRDVADTLTALMVQAVRSRLFDGVFLDLASPPASSAGVGTEATDFARLYHLQRLVKRCREAGGSDFTVYVNAVWSDRLLADGSMKEGFPFGLTNTASALQQKDGDWLKSETTAGSMGSSQLANYTLGIACLTGAWATHGQNRLTNLPYEAKWWFPAYSVTPAGLADSTGSYTSWLGEAWGEAVKVSSTLWYREFDKGRVYVAVTGTNVNFTTPTSYKPIGGGCGTSFSVSGFNALFLVRCP